MAEGQTIGDLTSGLRTAIWDISNDSVDHNLKWYLRHCEDEIAFVLRRTPSLFQQCGLLDTISQLKTHPKTPRKQLLSSSPALRDTEIQPDPDLALTRIAVAELAVRLMLLTSCVSASQESFGGDLFRPRWSDDESLENFVDRVYPLSSNVPQDSRSVRVDKLAVGYLTRYAKIEIVWSHRLTDHLMLLKRPDRKSLYLFRHPAFLSVSYDATTMQAKPHAVATTMTGATGRISTSEALSQGCLPPQLLRETLATYQLLFPRPDTQLSQTFLEKELLRHGLDDSFLQPLPSHHSDHQHPQDALDPTDVWALYQKYPYWAARLFALCKEADDPTPITQIERWSESRRNPRFTYWCTVVSLSIAVFFGFAATMLGALQVWISYCSWIDDPGYAVCSKGPRKAENAAILD